MRIPSRGRGIASCIDALRDWHAGAVACRGPISLGMHPPQDVADEVEMASELVRCRFAGEPAVLAGLAVGKEAD